MTKRRLFVLALAAASVTLVAYSGWLLWPVYQEHRAVRAFIHTVIYRDKTALDPAIEDLNQVGGRCVAVMPELVQLLSFPNDSVRWRACYAIGELAEAATALNPAVMRNEAVPALIASLSDKHIRIRAVYALGRIGPVARAAIPELIAALDHEDVYFNGQAGHALGRIGEAAIDPLLQAIATGSSQQSLRAIEVLGETGTVAPNRCIAALAAALESDSPVVRARAAGALSKFGKPAVPSLIQSLKRSTRDPYLITKTLGGIGPDAHDAIPSLIETITESGPHGNAIAAHALGQIGGVSELVKALDLETARLSVLGALKSRGGAAEQAIPTLIVILKSDRRPAVRESVVQILAQLGTGKFNVVPYLIELLEEQPSDGHDIRVQATQALGRIGPDARAAIPALEKLIDSKESPRLSLHAASALSAVDPGHPKVLSTMVETIERSKDFGDQVRALQILAKLGPTAAPSVPLVIRVLKQESSRSIAHFAIEVLSSIGPEAAEAVPVLVELLEPTERFSPIQNDAIRALGSIGPAARPAVPKIMELAETLDHRQYQQSIASALQKINAGTDDDEQLAK